MISSVIYSFRERVPLLFRTVVAASSLACAGSVSAHPHVWITYESVALMHGTALEAVKEMWTFSRGFPVALVGDLSDMPKAGPLGPKHVSIFKQQAFDSLKGADYFTHVFVNGKPTPFGAPRHFAVSIDDGRIVYSFELPLIDPVDLRLGQVQLGIWDETFFVDFQPSPKGAAPVVFNGTAQAACRAKPFEDKNHAIFGGAVYPLAVELAC